jgi:tetratricopeptide (TPR) repeat protein
MSILDRADSAESHQVRLTLIWFALRALMAVPFDNPAHKEFVPLWVRAFRSWTRSGAWYGLHGHALMGCLAALGSLAQIHFHSAYDADDRVRNMPHGSLASEYYSIAKIASQPGRLLDLALNHIQIGIDSSHSDTTNQIAIRASILLRMQRLDAALHDYQRVAENRKERGGQAYGEALNEWGYALLKRGEKRQGIELMEAGLEFLQNGKPSGFRVRAMRKLAEGYARCWKFRLALDLAAEAHEVAVAIGAYDQIRLLERFARYLCGHGSQRVMR